MEHTNKKGLLTALGCYVLWGLLPLYWALLHHVSPYNVLAQRIIWSGICMAIVVFGIHFGQFKKDFQFLKEQRSQIILLLLAAVIISINWFTYIWAIANNHVMDTSLGYYINPLLNVVLGVILFKEVLTTPKKLSVIIATIGIALLTYQVGSLPLISMILAVTFGLYGAVKKKVLIHPFTSIAVEAWLLTPLALLYTTVFDTTSWSYFGTDWYTALLLMGCGLTTTVPFILFSYGAQLLPLNLLGFLQYLAPTIIFLLSIFYFQESFDIPNIIAFSCIWIALAIYTMSNQPKQTK
ncbi:EamA family transporter RarD [Veillonella parvula]|uniref:EamA family transporter RarD n=1 Tax=Veillonella parvula TaxID=29466 RepID=UPI000E68E813|nr:EamA family transporter RarD [Veillonella parvula]RIW09007.1 EamA family transporter RarD [Veillonella parvula]